MLMFGMPWVKNRGHIGLIEWLLKWQKNDSYQHVQNIGTCRSNVQTCLMSAWSGYKSGYDDLGD